jgi:Fe-S cluster assembly protein SufD
VFVDGFFSPQLSQVTVTAAQLIVTNFAQAIKNQESLLKTYLTDQTSQDAFSNLNTACMQDGVFIYVPANCLVNEPLHVLFLNSGNHQSMQNFRNMIIVESHARVTLIEEHQSLENTAYLTNTVTQIYANEEAKINYTKIQNQNRQSFHIANTTITQKRSSRVDFHSYSLGGQLARENMSCYLNEKGASVLMQGLYLPFKQQHIDVHTCIHHQADHTTSEEYFKGLVAQKSRAVFNGKIVVTEKIKKAVANMQNKNLLVTPDCEVNAKPELEIYADDVKCRHGATIGQIDQEMLFYLRSRGIASEQAYHLLMLAFVAENLSMISCPVVANKVRNLITHYCEELSL